VTARRNQRVLFSWRTGTAINYEQLRVGIARWYREYAKEQTPQDRAEYERGRSRDERDHLGLTRHRPNGARAYLKTRFVPPVFNICRGTDRQRPLSGTRSPAGAPIAGGSLPSAVTNFRLFGAAPHSFVTAFTRVTASDNLARKLL
jgi:hypothetical protein